KNLRRVTGARQVGRKDDVLRHRFKGLYALSPILEMLLVHLEPRRPKAELMPDLLDRHEPLRLAVRERFQQYAVDDGVDGRGGADREGEGEGDRQRIRAVAQQAAQDVAKIERQLCHRAGLDGCAGGSVVTHSAALRSDRGATLSTRAGSR